MGKSRNFPDFIDAYLDLHSTHEASPKIHLWTCLSVLATSIERKLWMPRGHYDLYPNLFVFIVGPSGLIKKSTSTGFGVSLLRELPEIKIMSDRVTAASLIEQLNSAQKKGDELEGTLEHASMFIYASELIVFVKEVFGTVIELLTTFWDCPKVWSYKTKNSGNVLVKNVCLNMLAATTLQWLKEGITSQIMTAGFAGRVIFVCDSKGSGKWVAWPDTPPDFELRKEKLVEDLHQIHSLQGKMILTPEFKAVFAEWYDAHMTFVASINKDVRMNGYYGRKGEMILKVAMLKSVSEGDSLVLLPKHFQWGLRQLELLEGDLIDIYTPPQPSEDLDRKFKIMEFIFKKRIVMLKDLKYKFTKEFLGFQVDRSIEDLVGEGRLIVQKKIPLKDPNQVFVLNEKISTPWDGIKR